jgi:HSP20 family molecular chaperone IbpA
MQPYKRLGKGATLALFAAGLMATGGVASIGMQAFAQTPTAPNTPAAITTQAQDTTDNGKDGQDENAVLPAGGISEAQARAAITAKYPGMTIKDIELEVKNGTVVYGAELSDKTDVLVDAKTGVVSQEAPDANEANDTEINDGPDGQNETGEMGQN